MPFNTLSVATAVTPSVIETYFSHYLNRRPLRQKPTAHISYHEGLRLIRQFLDYSSKHTIEDLQSFTAQWVPVPTWVRTQDVEVPPQFLTRSANVIRKQLGPNGIERVGGENWWQWRRPETPLHAEWIEMKKDYAERKKAGTKCDRVIFYVHGGAYYFGSVDEHRYQMQRHARKLKARVLAPRYRLAPQFPFPCGLHDCIATYFYLLEHFDPNQILISGDSAGGGMVLAMLVTLRDQGCPLPAGTILLSPWVDLTHSFPSTSGDGLGDYIPPSGFHHKPSMAWPPPPTSDEEPRKEQRKFTQPVEQPFDVVELPATIESGAMSTKPSGDDLMAELAKESDTNAPIHNMQIPGMGPRLEIPIDDKLFIIREQIQMYAKNELLAHPLVSAVQQPSLGGLPPLLIQVGGGELLRDEQIYLAHKAANPRAYVPSDAIMNEYDPHRIILNQYPATDVQLQVWEDLCHVPHTLSFTRPAKYMYRSVSQFGAWALARAQHKAIDILDDDAVSVISDGEDPEEFKGMGSQESFGSIGDEGVTSSQFKLTSVGAIGKAGDELPPFKDHMIRQRVNRHGIIFPLPNRADIKCLHLDPNSIGAIKAGPVRKWLAKRAENEAKFASEYKKVMKKKLKEQKDWDKAEPGENPPPTALINRKKAGVAPEQKKKGKSWGLAMWSGWGSSHDESTIQREEKVVEEREKAEERAAHDEAVEDPPTRNESITTMNTPSTLAVPGQELDSDAKSKRRRSSASVLSTPWSRKERHDSSSVKREDSRPRSSYRQVKDAGQASADRNSAASPVLGPSGSRGLWDLSRRSSGASGKLSFTNRPTSVAAARPPSSLNPNPQSPNSPTIIQPTNGVAAPAMFDTGKEAVRIPGSDNTFLNPDSSRPHNGTVAYPFKLKKGSIRESRNMRSPSPNPSTMTLDSNEDEAASRGSTGLAELPAVSRSPTAEKPGSETDIGPIPAVPRTTLNEPEKINSASTSSPTAGRRVSMLPQDSSLLAQYNSREEDPVSPVESTTTSTNPIAFQPRSQDSIGSRDSRLGVLGADGMPLAAFPDNTAAMDNAPRQAPFKIRNPVYDHRVPGNVPPGTAVSQPGPSTETTRSAPFKMRHVIYDAKVAPVGSTVPGDAATTSPAASGINGTSKRDISPPSNRLPPPPAAAGLVPDPLPASPVDDTLTGAKAYTVHSAQTNNHLPLPTAVTSPRPVGYLHRTPSNNSSNAPPPTPPPKDALPTPPASVLERRGSQNQLLPKPSPPPTTALPPIPAFSTNKSRQPKQSPSNDSLRSKAPVVVPTSKYSKSTESLGMYGGGATSPAPAGAAAALAGPRQLSLQRKRREQEDREATSTFNAAAVAANVASGTVGVPVSKYSKASKEKIRNGSLGEAPPKIGGFDFEGYENFKPERNENDRHDEGRARADSDVHGDNGIHVVNAGTSRPPLETFVTANEGLGLGLGLGLKGGESSLSTAKMI